jgi:holo-[acyl-carrier protein] synthase
MLALCTGIDLLEINRLDELDPAVRQRFLERVFTPAEQELSQGSSTFLAGRFAAKEAVAKALGCGIGAVGWKEIEILRGKMGEPLLRLSGKADQMGKDLGLLQWSLSISHTRAYAVAVAIALGEVKKSPHPIKEDMVLE